jgi:hypothetical protein
MIKLLNWLIACVVLSVVLCGLFHDGCRRAILTDTLGGLVVGLIHGVLHVYCIHEVSNTRLSLTPSRVHKIILHDVRMDMVIGLLIGTFAAVACMCGK